MSEDRRAERSIELPLCVETAGDARAWKERIEDAIYEVVLLQRQAAYAEWIEWLAQAPEAQGLSKFTSVVNSHVSGDEVLLVSLAYDNGREVGQCLGDGDRVAARVYDRSLPGPASKQQLFGEADWERKAEVFRRRVLATPGLEALADEDVECLNLPEHWRRALFTEDEIAAWDAARLEAAVPASKSQGPRRM